MPTCHHLLPLNSLQCRFLKRAYFTLSKSYHSLWSPPVSVKCQPPPLLLSLCSLGMLSKDLAIALHQRIKCRKDMLFGQIESNSCGNSIKDSLGLTIPVSLCESWSIQLSSFHIKPWIHLIWCFHIIIICQNSSRYHSIWKIEFIFLRFPLNIWWLLLWYIPC